MHTDYPFLHKDLDLPEIQSLNPIEVVTQKAQTAYTLLQKPALVEDTAITFHAMGKLPGTFIKFFLQELGAEGLCRMLDAYKSRAVTIGVYLALATENGVKVFSATKKGMVVKHPRGDAVFGTDSIIVPEGSSKTWAEMNKEELIQTSVRRVAIKKLQEYLQSNSQLNSE